MKAYLADTNLLLRAIQRQNLELRTLARETIKTIYRRGDLLYVCPQNLVELWNVSTRPVSVNGLGLGIAETNRNIARCEVFFRLLPETPEIFGEWKRLVVLHSVSGIKVHDTRLVAAMNVHRVSTIVTFDVDDFKRFIPGIAVIHPADVVTSMGS